MNQTATYCPEDNKLRLYVGRVPRDEYERLKAEGWTSTPKQDCDFVATWTPTREDTALEYAGIIEDEDQSPQDRAADRAERFAGYRDRRHDEATGKADQYDAGPTAHGYQSQALAERRAARHDMQATRAVNLWSKAEYWQSRTAGVISHALHVSAPGVRMGRIKELEAEIRKREKDATEATAKNQMTWDIWNSIAGNRDLILVRACAYSLDVNGVKGAGEDGKLTPGQWRLGMALMMVGDVHTEYKSERYQLQKATLAALVDGSLTPEAAAKQWLENHPERPADWDGQGRWLNHCRLRLAYELQMLEAQGGRAAFVEMEAGGWIGKYQIQKVNKSVATGRVVSVVVTVVDRGKWGEREDSAPRQAVLKVERLSAEVYRAPTDEERAAFAEGKKADKKAAAAAKKDAPAAPALCNPTNEDAERLQAVWNEQKKRARHYDQEPRAVIYTTQASYSANLKAGAAETHNIIGGGELSRASFRSADFPTVAMVRGSRGSVVVLTDKPQKALPAIVWEDPRPATRAEVVSKILQLERAVLEVFAGVGHYLENLSNEDRQLFGRACLVGLAQVQSACQWGLTEEGWAIARKAAEVNTPTAAPILNAAQLQLAI